VTPLYAQVLGDDWHRIAEPIRALHQGTIRAIGSFRVTRGSNWIANLLANWIGLPAAGENVVLELKITASEGTERWTRRFDELILESVQRLDGRGLLVERMGPMEFAMELEVADGALVYHVRRLALRTLGVRVPLPPIGLAACTATERPNADGRSIDVFVSINAPIVGLIAQYEGACTVVDSNESLALP
jgi:hypothetical protein